MSVTASFSVSPKERAVQEALEARLEPSEVLESYTQCRYNPGGLTDKVYWLGLTRRRLVILRKDLPLRVYSIYRPFVQDVSYREPGWLNRGGLSLQLGGATAERVDFPIEPAFRKRAALFARAFNGLAPVTLNLTAGEVIGQVVDFYELGMLRAARYLLHERRTADPLVEIDPQGAALDWLITTARVARWTAVTMHILALVVVLLMTLFGFGAAGVGLVFSLLALYELARRRSHRGVALALSLLAASAYLLTNLVSAGFLAVLMWLSFAVTLALVLAGRPTRKRIAAGIAVFLLGFAGAAGLIVAAAGLGQGPGASLMPLASAASVNKAAANRVGAINLLDAYSDGITAGQGWPLHNEPDLFTRLVAGRYAVTLKAPNTTFYAFPAVDFTPRQGSVDVEVPASFRAAQGTFGMVCGFHPESATAAAARPGSVENTFYRIEIDPGQRRFAVLRQTGEDEKSLTYNNWRPLLGLRPDRPVGNLTVACAGEQIVVKVDAVEQARIRVGAGQTFATGKMGLFVSTWEDTGPQGYEILFSNARFDKMGE